jgi:hypothetical protein
LAHGRDGFGYGTLPRTYPLGAVIGTGGIACALVVEMKHGETFFGELTAQRPEGTTGAP